MWAVAELGLSNSWWMSGLLAIWILDLTVTGCHKIFLTTKQYKLSSTTRARLFSSTANKNQTQDQNQIWKKKANKPNRTKIWQLVFDNKKMLKQIYQKAKNKNPSLLTSRENFPDMMLSIKGSTKSSGTWKFFSGKCGEPYMLLYTWIFKQQFVSKNNWTSYERTN